MVVFDGTKLLLKVYYSCTGLQEQSCLGHLFVNRTVDLWNALPASMQKTKHAVHLRNLFLSSISKDSTLHLVPVHCVLGQIHVIVYLVVAIDDTC